MLMKHNSHCAKREGVPKMKQSQETYQTVNNMFTLAIRRGLLYLFLREEVFMLKQITSYNIEKIEKSIKVRDFIEGYVNVPKFLKYCKDCPNYNKVWSCPEYDFDPMDIWKKYETLDLVATKIIYNLDFEHNEVSEKMIKESNMILKKEKYNLMREYMSYEKKDGSVIFLSAGSCDLCGYEKGINNCAKLEGKPCRHPEQLRYSIESLGGDVVKTAKEIFDIELKWSDGTELPEYNVLVCGILKGWKE